MQDPNQDLPLPEELSLDPEAQKQALERMLRAQAAYARATSGSTAVAPGTPQLGSFQDDDPETHQSFATPESDSP